MTSKPKTEHSAGDSELFIHLDLAGLASLLRAVEAAMTEGRGRMVLLRGSGMTVSSGSSDAFGKVTVTFTDVDGPADDAGRSDLPDPEPLPRRPVLEMQS
jgi:hypothetical protein